MSSGGFYKYRCKNFYSHNCPNWVWVNNSPCATCIAEGRDAEERSLPSSTAYRVNIVAPRLRDDILQDTFMESVAPSDVGESGILHDKGNSIIDNGQQPQTLPLRGSTMTSSYQAIARRSLPNGSQLD
ncbi:hypothetical protein THARTR1_05450 [Trichoderma harzianum]|uniref:Uncharacterized protein n=1 Tax=Trichoderma harzianum TaxID=5544 RepID=A0A2K0U8Z2_TRIHA|nr:hypothetical protein THARTR1_05450 [Trichoderma harzianum]